MGKAIICLKITRISEIISAALLFFAIQDIINGLFDDLFNLINFLLIVVNFNIKYFILLTKYI
jgi:hypothetical protein